MRAWKLRVAIVLAAVLGSGTAIADVFTPVLVTTANRGILCSIANVGGSDVTVRVQVMGADSAEVLATKDALVGPGEGTSLTWIASTGAQYCAFLGRFSAKVVRANASMVDTVAGSVLFSIPAE